MMVSEDCENNNQRLSVMELKTNQAERDQDR